MKIIYWNVNGIRAVQRRINFNKFLTEQNADIMCLGEIKASKTENNMHFQMMYPHQYWNISKARKGYSGTVVFSKVKPISVEKSPFDNEGRLINLEYEDFNLINLYVPNSGQELKRLEYRVNEWDEKLREYIKAQKKPVIVVGDMNVARYEIDLARPKSNTRSSGFTKEERESFEKTLELGLVDTFRHFHPEEVKYSYWGYRFRCREKNLGWRIDYFLVSKEMMKNVRESNILADQMGSDHAPIILIKN